MLRFLYRLPRLLLKGLVRGYQFVISPHLPNTCRYQPSCSNYALQAFDRYGAGKGLVLTVHRLLRCHPWGGHGYDPPRWFGESAHEHAHQEHRQAVPHEVRSPLRETGPSS